MKFAVQPQHSLEFKVKTSNNKSINKGGWSRREKLHLQKYNIVGCSRLSHATESIIHTFHSRKIERICLIREFKFKYWMSHHLYTSWSQLEKISEDCLSIDSGSCSHDLKDPAEIHLSSKLISLGWWAVGCALWELLPLVLYITRCRFQSLS